MEESRPVVAYSYTDHQGRRVIVSFTPTQRRVTIGRTTCVYDVAPRDVPQWIHHRPREKRPEPQPEASPTSKSH